MQDKTLILKDGHSIITCDNCGSVLGTFKIEGKEYYFELEYKCRICGMLKSIRRSNKKQRLLFKLASLENKGGE